MVVGAGGYWFDLAALDVDDDASEREGEGDEIDYGGEHVYLFIPPGWYHWLLADSAWHVAWSGSYFPAAAVTAAGSSSVTSSAANHTRTGGRRARKPRRLLIYSNKYIHSYACMR